MADDTWQAFSDRIAWEGTVRIACEALDAPLDPNRRTRLDELNTGVLATLGMLGERPVPDPSGEDTTALALARIDAKLDVLLEMFNRHLAGHLEMPQRRQVRLNARGILIEDWQPPREGLPVLVRMHFDACAALPLELPGRIGTPAPPARGGFVTFDEAVERIRTGIEHLVFRQHRRQVAEARRESQQPPR